MRTNGFLAHGVPPHASGAHPASTARTEDPASKPAPPTVRSHDGRTDAASSATRQTEYGVNRPDAAKPVGGKLSMYA